MISDPPKLARLTEVVPKAWLDWFQAVAVVCQDIQSTGTTANRPTTGLYPGRFYFDTSLGANGKPIWRNKGNNGWVDSNSTPV